MKTVQDDEIFVDDRSVDDLLSFINGDSNGSGTVKISKSKKKNRQRKEKQKDSPLVNPDKNCKGLNNDGPEVHNDVQPSHTERTELPDVGETIANESDDDEIDPLMKEIDREVEDFTRRLSLNWPERKQELLYGPGRNSSSLSIHYHDNWTEKRSLEPG